jgi:hypothetical protein
MKTSADYKNQGVSLIIVVLVMAFLFSVGLLLLSITGTGPRIAGNVRFYQEAFNAAEAGFDASWVAIENNLADGLWVSFSDHYLQQPAGIDLPSQPTYFRRLTDEQILNYIDPEGDGTANLNNVLFCNQTYVPTGSGPDDPRYTYTCFLINDEAETAEDATDALLICIGVIRAGNKILATARLEVLLAVERGA